MGEDGQITENSVINPQVNSLSASSTLKITALTKKLKKEGKDVINFAAGEPDFDTPSFIKEEAKKAIDAGFTKYTPSAGILELREVIANKLREENKLNVESKNIIVTAGAKYAVFAGIWTLVGRKEEVIIPAPYWVSYPEMVKLIGAKIKILPAYKRDNFKIKVKNLRKAVTSKTKLLILNYPSNPTGITYSYDELKEIYDLVREKNIYVLSDEIYEKLLYDGDSHVSFASFPGADKFTFTVNGFSKSFSMTGWRLGYLAGDELLISQASKVIDHTTSCACSISQKAALAALTNKEWQDTLKREFEKRRNSLWEGLKKCKNIDSIKPQGTFYMFCDIRKTGLNSEDFASRLLEKYMVSVVPADSFGAQGFVRFSFAASCEEIEKGVERVKKFVEEL